MKKILFLVSCFVLMINSVDAVTLNCPDVASLGEVISCKIEDDKYIGLKAKYEIDKGIKYGSLNVGSSWRRYYTSESGFSVGNVSNDQELSFSLELDISDNVVTNQEYLIKLVNVEAVDTNYEYVKLDDLSSKVKVVSNINTLKSLEVSNHALSPKFDSSVTSYKVVTEEEVVTIKAVASDLEATISGDIGEKKLQYGMNIFTVNVKSVKGEVRKYQIYITRKVKEVKKDTNSTLNSDVTLKSLSISSGNINFNKDKFLYSVEVNYDIDNIDVKAVPTSDKATVKIEGPDKLEVGENTISIIVTAEDGTVGKYVLVVNRKEKLSSDATIKTLNIAGYTLEFFSDVYEYELEIGDEDKLDIDVSLNDKKATYKVTGNKNLKNNSVINIQVQAEDGTFLNYKIKIIRQNEENSSFVFEKIGIVPLLCFVGLVILVLIIKVVKTRKLVINDKNDEKGD